MGKQRRSIHERSGCSDDSAPVCGSDCCSTPDNKHVTKKYYNTKDSHRKSQHQQEPQSGIHELIVIGAGPHGHSLLLRLLEPDADFLSDKERHLQAEYRRRMRPDRDVMQHIKKLSRGPRATLRPLSKLQKKKIANSGSAAAPPPLSLEEVQKSVIVVDRCGGWMSGWNENFKSLRITKLRSLMNAHNDPYDHRSLEYYAEFLGRGEELVTLPSLKQRDQDFKGPYQVPSTAIFQKFNELLSRAYGVEDAVCTGTVQSINPVLEDEGNGAEPIFEVKIAFGNNNSSESPTNITTVKTRRVVSCMGPMFRASEALWEVSLRKELGTDQHCAFGRILHAHQITPYIKAQNEQSEKFSRGSVRRVLIVGGGITSVQLALLAAKLNWCNGVTLIQRSRSVPRHFDIENKWMGPKRGRLLEDFWSLNMHDRAQQLQEARLGGSIPPEIIQELQHCQNQQSMQLQVKEEVEISEVHWIDDRFHVSLDDGSDCEPFDMIWLATGAKNHIDHYSALSHLREVLPVSVTNGLPVLNKNLSWRAPTGEYADEPNWKQIARDRFWCMGALAALELGPDALNLIGARHGSVRVAEAIRRDYDKNRRSQN